MTTMQKLTLKSLADLAYDRIDSAILSGDLAPGAQVSEAELAIRLGISRGPLREALSRLEGRKLVRRIRQQGVVIVDLTDREINDILQMREVMEGFACRLAAQNMTDSQLASLDSCIETRILAHANTPARSDLHYRIAENCGNDYLRDLLCLDLYYRLRLYRARTGQIPDHYEGAIEEHRQIVRALQARDADLAEALMRRHVARARERLNLDLAPRT